jgi:hypothetical protein
VAITSREIPAKDDPPTPKQRRSPIWPLGIVAIIVGAILWPLGARYSLEGWIYALNILLDLVHLPAAIPMPVGWWWLLFIPPGILYSLVEIRVQFGPPPSWAHLPSWAIAIGLLLFVHGTDIGSTFAGYLAPPAGAWAIHVWAAGDGRWALGLWAIILTYLPERAFMQGLRWVGVR